MSFVAFTLFRLPQIIIITRKWSVQYVPVPCTPVPASRFNWICLLNWIKPMQKREIISFIAWRMETKFYSPIKILPVQKKKKKVFAMFCQQPINSNIKLVKNHVSRFGEKKVPNGWYTLCPKSAMNVWMCNETSCTVRPTWKDK